MKSDPQEMLRLARLARAHAYAPYSQFQVGVCIADSDGKYYVGCNVENASYPMSQCAEASAIGNMIVCGGTHIRAILVVTDTEQGAFPCGGCLQKLSEFVLPDAEIISANLAGAFQTKPFSAVFNSQFTRLFSDLQKNV